MIVAKTSCTCDLRNACLAGWRASSAVHHKHIVKDRKTLEKRTPSLTLVDFWPLFNSLKFSQYNKPTRLIYRKRRKRYGVRVARWHFVMLRYSHKKIQRSIIKIIKIILFDITINTSKALRCHNKSYNSEISNVTFLFKRIFFLKLWLIHKLCQIKPNKISNSAPTPAVLPF